MGETSEGREMNLSQGVAARRHSVMARQAATPYLKLG